MHVWELLKRRFSGRNYNVEWTAGNDPCSPFDICVFENGKPILYVEVKSTTRKSPIAIGYISSAEWRIRERYAKQHELYFVVFRDVQDLNPAIYLVDIDCRAAAVKWRLEFPLASATPLQGAR
jgi:hypothetical protein